jgi:hypothetical protein
MAVVIGGSIWVTSYTAVYLPIKESAGQQTTITVMQQWLADVGISVYLAWGAAATCGGWAMLERRKRLRERAEKDTRVIELLSKARPVHRLAVWPPTGFRTRSGSATSCEPSSRGRGAAA